MSVDDRDNERGGGWMEVSDDETVVSNAWLAKLNAVVDAARRYVNLEGDGLDWNFSRLRDALTKLDEEPNA